MKTFTKNNFYSLVATAVSLATPLLVFAQNTSKLEVTALGIVKILEIVVTAVFVMAVIVFGWGIVLLIIAAGDPAKIKQARQFIIWGVVGIAILASIYGLIVYLRDFFGVVPGGGGVIIPPEVVPSGGGD